MNAKKNNYSLLDGTILWHRSKIVAEVRALRNQSVFSFGMGLFKNVVFSYFFVLQNVIYVKLLRSTFVFLWSVILNTNGISNNSDKLTFKNTFASPQTPESYN